MKYNPGDCLSLRVNDQQFLSGLVLAGQGHHEEKYPIVLTGSVHSEKPPMAWFYACDMLPWNMATSPNEFPTVKLYKAWEGEIFYWQLFSNPNPGDTFHLVVNEGLLGGSDRASEVKGLSKEEAREAYHELIRIKKLEGYQEATNMEMMTLQFQTNDAWGATEDLDFRNEIWEYLDRHLYWTGNGAFSGGDIGSGTINLFFEVISPTVAVDTIVQALAEKQVDRSFVIVHAVPEEGGGTAFNVVYPKEYKLTFHL